MVELPTGDTIAAIAALGTAAFGVVDVLKVFGRFGPSNRGFAFIKHTLEPFAPALSVVDTKIFIETLQANWINGVPIAEQKAKARGIIHLGLTAANAGKLADAAGIDREMLIVASRKIDKGEELTPNEVGIIGRFDAIVAAKLDTAYERADQMYRNTAKLFAAIAASLLAMWGNALLNYPLPWWGAILLGFVSTPLAPIAKDLTSSLTGAMNAIASLKK